MLHSTTILNTPARRMSLLLDKTFASYQLFPIPNGRSLVVLDGLDNFTHKQLVVHSLWSAGKDMPEFLDMLAKSIIFDPPGAIDTAIQTYVEAYVSPVGRHTAMTSLHFDISSSCSGAVWHNGATYTVAIKGAPEEVLVRCDLTENEHERAIIKLHSLAAHGHKVIAIAHASLTHTVSDMHDLSLHTRLIFDGFISLTDTLQRTHMVAINKLEHLGLDVLILTGEHSETAYAVGRELCIVTSRQQLLSSKHMYTMSDDELSAQLLITKIVTRVSDSDKKRIISLLPKQI